MVRKVLVKLLRKWFLWPAAAKSLQSCPTLCHPLDGSPPGFPVPGILQARILEWVAISFSNAWKWKVKVKLLSCVRLLATPWTVAYQAPPSMGFSRQEYWSGVPSPSLRKYPNIFNFASSILGTHGFPRKDMGGKTERLGILHILGNIQMVLSGLRNQNRASRNQAWINT